MTIYPAFHLLYFMLHGQFLLRDLSAAPAGQWWKCALSWLVAEVISQLTIYYMCRCIKRCEAMRSTEQKAKTEQQSSKEFEALKEQLPSRELAALKEQLDAIRKDIGKTPDDKTLTGQHKDLKKLLQKESEAAEQRYAELDKHLRNLAMGQSSIWRSVEQLRDLPVRIAPNSAKPVTLEEVAQAYLDICDKACGGDASTGVPSCQFYETPDVDENGFPCSGTCRLKSYRYKSN